MVELEMDEKFLLTVPKQHHAGASNSRENSTDSLVERKISVTSTKSNGQDSFFSGDEPHQLTLERMLNPGIFFQSVLNSGKSHKRRRSKHQLLSHEILITLQQAARDGQTDVVKKHILICGKDKKKLNRKDEEQTTALHYAVRYGHFDIVKLLVEGGANVNVAGESGATPLHYASRYVCKASRFNGYTAYDQFEPYIERGPTRNKSLRTLRHLISSKRLNIGATSKNKETDEPTRKRSVAKGLRSLIDLSVFKGLPSPKRSTKGDSVIQKPYLQRKGTIHGSLEDLTPDTPLLVDKENEQAYSNLELGSLFKKSQDIVNCELDDPVSTRRRFNVDSTSGDVETTSKQRHGLTGKQIVDYGYLNKPLECESEKPLVIIADTDDVNGGCVDIQTIDALILSEVRSIASPEHVMSVTSHASIKSLKGSTSMDHLSQRSSIENLDEILLTRSNEHLNQNGSLPASRMSSPISDHGRFKVRQLLDVPILADDSILLYLIKKKGNINMKDFYGSTPLHYAAMRGNVAAARQLLNQKTINIELKDRTQMTALHCACSNGSYEVAKMLLKHGADLRCRDEEDMTPLHFAAMEGHIDIVKLLFTHGEKHGGVLLLAKMIMDQDRDEQTALHLAVENGHFDIVEHCIKQGANVNFVKANLITPLHLACTSGQFDIVKILVENDADVEAKNALQETPLHRAALFNRCSIVEYLLDKGAEIDCRDKDKETPLMMAVRKNNVETVEILLKRKADVTVKDSQDKTCLYVAAEEDCEDSFELIKGNPKVIALLEEFDKNENTPLHIAATKGHLKVVEMLLDMGACIDAKNDASLTPLHLAAKYGQCGIVRLLLSRDVKLVNDEDDSSNTPLHLAALEGHVNVLEGLLVSGAAVDARNANLWTALDCAASRGWTWCAECLLNDDSPIDPVDKAKTTPLHLASKGGHVEMIKLLLSKKADIARKDNLGRNCLDWAIENNQRDAAMAILDDERWREALKSCNVEGYFVTTPMRKLIQKLPDVAEKVFNQCIKGNGLPKEHPLYEISCSYEFLEDTFTEWGPSTFDYKQVDIQHQQTVANLAYSSQNKKNVGCWRRLTEKIRQPGYLKKQIEIKNNHPLKFMVKNERTRLLCHPLVTYLLRHKWRTVGRHVYYSKLILFIVFLAFLTGYALTIIADEYTLNCKQTSNTTTECTCERSAVKDRMYPNQPSIHTQRLFIDFGKHLVLILALVSLIIEMIKMATELHHYFRIHRLFEVAAYVLSILYVLESYTWPDGSRIEMVTNSRCTSWYRSLGALTVWLSWISLVLFMRKFPKLGIYVVMFTDILKTFAQFSMVFGLFIIAFGLGFHMLLYEQKPIAFITPARAILKTTMGMLGEFEYDSVFNDVYNPMGMAWFIYVAYLVINCIIIMNLLVGLAVDDIKGVQETAALKRLAMQVDLTLDVEKALPLAWQRKLIKFDEVIIPNAEKEIFESRFSKYDEPLEKSMIQDVDIEVQSATDQLKNQQTELKETVRGLRSKVKVLEAQNNRMEAMLNALVSHHNITVDYDKR